MPRFVLAFVLIAYGAAIAGTSARAATNELSRCLEASTILGAGGDVSDQELKAAQNACAQLKQTAPDRDTLRRVNAAAETIGEEAQRRAAAGH